ncbi:nucleotide disphospho-sugar-binding domain-containing protein [Nocardia sp. NPDC020380]|uniref:nucleotide disphospho-sugar-binding domain-containing protein n=1 Tax=Nocardia sp. NPDC020380 TaxID=3364309 RepID=UPI0037B05F65
MRVLFATSPWPTHYFMTVPTAWAFRAAGHEVIVVSQPSMAELIARSGMAAARVGPDIDLVAIRKRTLPFERKAGAPPPADGENDGADQVFDAWRAATTANVDPLVDFAKAWRPDIVLCDPMCPGGLVAAAVLGVPGIRHLWAPDFLGSAGAEQLLPQLPGFYEPFERRGVRVEGDPALRTVDPCPPSMEPPPSDRRIHVQFVPYNGTGVLSDRLPPRSGRPRICLTWGMSVTRIIGSAAFLLPQIISALSGLDAEIVVAVDATQRAMLGSVADNVRVHESAPLHMLLPTCDVIVHQGGAGSTLTAARYGVRQLAITHLPDQANVAMAFAGTGAGIHLSGEEITPADIRRAVHDLLADPGYRAGADRLRGEILAQPSPIDVAGQLCALTAASPATVQR